jgi:prepilin-type N-terminal cleavage/methylation domain-containing protein
MKVFKRNGRRQGFTLIELMIVIAIIGVLAAIAVPNFKAARERANTRACYANQKTVVGAMEMYNLDKNTKRMRLDGRFFDDLRSGGYLQSVPQDPGAGPDTMHHYHESNSGNGISCSVHGSIQ